MARREIVQCCGKVRHANLIAAQSHCERLLATFQRHRTRAPRPESLAKSTVAVSITIKSTLECQPIYRLLTALRLHSACWRLPHGSYTTVIKKTAAPRILAPHATLDRLFASRVPVESVFPHGPDTCDLTAFIPVRRSALTFVLVPWWGDILPCMRVYPLALTGTGTLRIMSWANYSTWELP